MPTPTKPEELPILANSIPTVLLPATRGEPSRASLVLGTMNFGRRTPEDEAVRIIGRAREAGCAVFDTANVYNDGESERIVGRALGKARKDVVVATKVGLFGMMQGRREGLRPEVIQKACEDSLRRLGTDVIDLYYLHAPDPDVPLEDSLGAMGRLVTAGKIRFVGMSNYASWQILEAFHWAERTGTPKPVVAQQMYNLAVRQLEIEYFKFTAAHPIHTTVYNPLAGGLLAGKLSGEGEPTVRFEKNRMYQKRYATPRMLDASRGFAAIAAKHELSPTELAYAWIVSRKGVDSVLVGPGTLGHLEDALSAWTKVLPREAASEIDALSFELAGTDATYAR